MARTRTRNQDPSDEQNTETMSDSRRRRRGSDDTNAAVSPRKERQTPSQRSQKPRGTSNSLISRIPVVRSIAAYLSGVGSELQKVTWPSREETIRLTTIVLAVTIAFAIALGLLDLFLGQWFRQAFSTDSEPIFLAIAAVVAVLVGGTYTFARHRI